MNTRIKYFTLTLMVFLSVFSCKNTSDEGFSPLALVPLLAPSNTDSTCPAGYVKVPYNSAVGTNSDFCVAKFEMKCNSDVTGLACSNNPISQSANKPWVNITQANAIIACSSLGANYHLLTNAERMTVARNIESVAENWSSGTVNTGAINSGHNDSVPNNALEASTDDKNCYFTGQGTSDVCSTWDSQIRTHQLSNGESIWDFAGNVIEIIDWYVTPANKAYYSTDTQPVAAWIEWSLIDTNIGLSDEMKPSTWQALNTTLDSTNGIGKYWAGTNTAGGVGTRGGNFAAGSSAGIYTIGLVFDQTASIATNAGFRCAYSL